MEGYKGTVNTLGDLKRHGMGLYAHCAAENVGHGAPLDLDALIDRFGADYVFINETRIAASCRCKTCGHLGAHIRVVANTIPTAGNPYLKAKGL